jgi:hypothetical protein
VFCDISFLFDFFELASNIAKHTSGLLFVLYMVTITRLRNKLPGFRAVVDVMTGQFCLYSIPRILDPFESQLHQYTKPTRRAEEFTIALSYHSPIETYLESEMKAKTKILLREQSVLKYSVNT